MARVFTRNEASAIFGAALGEVWTTLGDAKGGEIYKKFLKEIKDPHAKRITQQFAYFTQPSLKGDGQGIEYDDLKTGTSLSIDPETRALGVRLTFEGLEDMRRQPFGSFSSAALVAASKLGEAFRKVVAQRKEIQAAQLVLNAATSTGTAGRQSGAGYDAVALASASHPILSNTSVLGGTTFSNVGAASALSQSAIQTILTTEETIPTLEGLVRPLGNKWKLMVGPTNRMTAYQVVETTKKRQTVGTQDWDVPGLADFDIEVIVNPYFGASSTVYSLSNEDCQLGYWDVFPETIESEHDFETKGEKYSCHYRWVELHEGPYGFHKSAGA